MEYNNIIANLEKLVGADLPAFKSLTIGRKLKLINQDIAGYIKSKNKVNYYTNKSYKTGAEDLSSKFHYMELLSSTRGRLRIGSLSKDEQFDFVEMMEKRLKTALKSINPKVLEDEYDFIISGCTMAIAIEDEDLKQRLKLIKEDCSQLLENPFGM